MDHFRLIVRDELSRWNDLSAINTYLLSIDGLSGAGKSTLADNLRSVVQSLPGVSLYRHAIDHFVATPRDSPQRRRMTDSTAFFWQYVFDRQAMIDVATGIVKANGAGCSIPVQTLYSRETGSVRQGVVSVPAGRTVVLVDGIDSTRIMEELSERVSCPQMRVLVMNPPHVALERAARRDRRHAPRTLQKSRDYRRREFQYLVPQILGQNIRHVDLLYME